MSEPGLEGAVIYGRGSPIIGVPPHCKLVQLLRHSLCVWRIGSNALLRICPLRQCKLLILGSLVSSFTSSNSARFGQVDVLISAFVLFVGSCLVLIDDQLITTVVVGTHIESL